MFPEGVPVEVTIDIEDRPNWTIFDYLEECYDDGGVLQKQLLFDWSLGQGPIQVTRRGTRIEPYVDQGYCLSGRGLRARDRRSAVFR